MLIRRFVTSCCMALTLSGTAGLANAQTLPQSEDATFPAQAQPGHITSADRTVSGDVIGDILSPLGRDFRNLLNERNLFVLGLGAVGSLGAQPLDGRVANATWARGTLGDAMAPGHIIGNVLVQSGAAFATYMVGRALDKPRVATVGSELLRAQIVSQLTAQAVKIAARRTRPDGTTLSFPSGHTASAFATATVLQSNFGWKAGVPAFSVAALIASSRMKDDRHYLSDVIAGATIGILAGRSVTIGKGSARFSVSPMALPGGLGVNFVRVQP